MPLDIDSLKRHLSKHFITLVGNQVVPAKRMRQFWFTPLDAPAENYHVANKKYVDDNAAGGSHASNHEEGGSDQITGDIELDSTSFLYLGDSSTNGSWRIGIVGGKFEIQKREAGSWNYYGRFGP